MSTIDENEVEKFAKIAEEWWNPAGKFKPLHQFNPIRLSFFKEFIAKFYQLNATDYKPFTGLKFIDIGCGGGLVAEPLFRFGAEVDAIDAAQRNIEVAKIHAQKNSLNINYFCSSAEELAKNNAQNYDVVFALEIIEHVANVEEFVGALANLTKKDGLVFVATLNRSLKSLLMAKFGVEYILRWLPIGTHDWRKFLKPSEVNSFAEKNNLQLLKMQGFKYDLIGNKWSLADDLSINYCAVFKKIS